MILTFDEFQLMVKETKFEIIILSETWLKNDKNLSELVRNSPIETDEERVAGVGVHKTDCIT